MKLNWVRRSNDNLVDGSPGLGRAQLVQWPAGPDIDRQILTLTIKCRRALKETGMKSLVIAGGVGANSALRAALHDLCQSQGVSLFFPRLEFCTDNGAMIAYVGCERLMAGEREVLTADVRARWPLHELSPP